MKKHLLYSLFLPLFTILFMAACERDFTEVSKTGKLSFSTDTIHFDTIFTQIGSVTRNLRVYNPNNQDVVIESIRLANGNMFHVNIDGDPVGRKENIRLRAKDSLYIFVEVKIDPTDQSNPFVVNDQVQFTTNGHEQDVDLVAYGQDVHFYDAELIQSQNWVNDKPYLVYRVLVVDSLSTLTIQPGAQVYFHRNASLVVRGTLKVNGTREEPVVFQGDRTDELFTGYDFNKVPGQWGAIALIAGSRGHEINHAIIKNATAGIQVGEFWDYSYPDLKLTNSIIQNASYAGLYALGGRVKAYNTVIANCGYHTVAMYRGGSYEFIHCTLANYWSTFSNRSDPSVLFTNYFLYKGEDPETGEEVLYYFDDDLDSLFFGNSIIYGNLEHEIGYADTSGKAFHYEFNHCLMKLDESFEHEEKPEFVNILTEAPDSLFQDTEEFDFTLRPRASAKDKGSISFAREVPYDLEGNSRLLDQKPDLGAYELVEE